MKWTTKKPVEGGFYYWQDQALRNFSEDAVMVVQVSRYKNREGLSCQTLHLPGDRGNPSFNCDIGKEPAGRWAGPLPNPR